MTRYASTTVVIQQNGPGLPLTLYVRAPRLPPLSTMEKSFSSNFPPSVIYEYIDVNFVYILEEELFSFIMLKN